MKHAVILFFLAMSVCLISQGGASRPELAGERSADPLPNGVYAVQREVDREEDCQCQEGEVAVAYRRSFLEDSDAPTTFVVVRPSDYVAVVPADEPTVIRGKGDRPELMVTLSPELVDAVARFTKKHVGNHVAFVVGNEVVTTHTVREPILDGKIRITRCGDNACEYLLTQLKPAD